MKPFLAHLGLATLWTWLSGGDDLADLTLGTLLGFGLLWLFSPLFGAETYLQRVFALLALSRSFGIALLRSSFQIVRLILSPRLHEIRPGFVRVPVKQLGRYQILVLSHLLTLTPGTTTAEISEDWSELVVHAIDARDEEAVLADLNRTLIEPLMRFSR